MAEPAPENWERAAVLVRDSFVANPAELPRSGVDPSRLLVDPLEVTQRTMNEWNAAHLDLVGCVTFSRDPDPHAGVLDQLAHWNSVIAEHGTQLLRIDDAVDVALVRSDPARTGVLISVHLGEHIRTLDDVDLFHKLGQRNCIIVNDAQNRIGSASQERGEGGLSTFGQAVVERMNTVGMAVDISHANTRTCLDVLEVATRPVVLSHINAHALCPNVKNKPDEVFTGVAASGGIIGVAAVAPVVGSGATVEHLLDHFDHLRRLVGARHLALGFESPAQGYDDLRPEHTPSWPTWVPEGAALDVQGFIRPDRIVLLAAGLLTRGWSEPEVVGVLGDNYARALAEILPG